MPSSSDTELTRKITSVSTSTILKVVGVFLALYVLFLIRDIILLVVISAILASALNPLVEWLYGRVRFPRGLTVMLVYILFVGIVVLIVSLLVPTLITEFSLLGSNIQELRGKLDAPGYMLNDFFARYGLSNILQSVGDTVSSLTSGIFEKTVGFFSGLFDVITVLVISFYLVSQQDGMKDFLKSITPVSYHAVISNVVLKAQRKLGQWMLGQLALMVSIFVMTYIALSLLGVKYALILALFAGLLEIVPYLGPIISAIPGILVASLQSPTMVLFVIIVYWGVQQVENYLLVPRIIGKSIGANPLVILLALLIGFKIAGIIGILISAPIVAVGSVFFSEYEDYRKSAAEQEVKS